MIDTLEYAKQLETAGISREQSEAHTAVLSEILTKEVVMKEELKKFQMNVDHQFQLFDQKLKNLESRLIIKLGAIVVISLTVMKTFLN